MRGTLALAAAGFIAKLLSAVQRVLVARWLGAEAIGLYELAMPLLSLGISLCSLGMPVALSAAVARARERGDVEGVARAHRSARILLVCCGSAGALAVLMLAGPLAQLYGNPRAAGAIMVIAPSIALATYLAGERAWLQGSGRVPASAASVAAEQVARVGAALAASLPFIGRVAGRAEEAARAISWSPAVGAAGALCTAWVADRAVPVGQGALHGGRPAQGIPRAGAGPGSLLRTGMANWGSGVISALATAVDTVLITWRLRASGLSPFAATAGIGELNGMALPLAVAPTVLFGALGSALLPSSAADWARGDTKSMLRKGQMAYLWALAIAIPCAVVLAQFARPLTVLFYRNVAAAGPLAILGWAVIPLAMTYMAAVLANAADHPTLLIPGVSLGAVTKTSLVLWLTGRFGLGVRGAAVATVAGLSVNALWNILSIGREFGCMPPWAEAARSVIPAALAQAVAGGALWMWLGHSPEAIRAVLSLVGGLGVYGVALMALWENGRSAIWRM